MTYWIVTSIPEDHPDDAVYGDETVGIADDDEGGVILYCHADSVERIISALIRHDLTEQGEV